MSKDLFIQAILKFISGVIITGLLLFLPAGTIRYYNAWLFMGLLFIPMFFAGIIMLLKCPELLRKRLNAKEKQDEQKLVILLSGMVFVLGFVIAGLDFRYKWLPLPNWVSLISAIVLVFAYLLYAEVLRENVYISRIIEVQENQKVIDTGLYGIVRHPMYGATILLFLSIPLVLGSLISFVIFLAFPFIIALRIRNEEKVLEEELDGYAEYKSKIKFKLLPFVW